MVQSEGPWLPREVLRPGTTPPPPSVSRLSMQSGRGSIGLGLVLLLGGVFMFVATVRNPSFDPARGIRAPIEDGNVAFDVPSAGSYVLYLETDECRDGMTELVRVGEGMVSPTPVEDPRFQIYEYAGLCGSPVAEYELQKAGLWSAFPPAFDGNAVLFEADRPPVHVNWEGTWLYVALAVGGLVLLVRGVVVYRRWNAALAAYR